MLITAYVYVQGSGTLVCAADSEMALQPGEQVVVLVDQEHDSGAVEEVSVGGGAEERRVGTVVRRLAPADQDRLGENQKQADSALNLLGVRARAAGLWVKPLAAHYNLDGTRLAILFGSDDTVDLRRLAAMLQPDIKAPVTFRQVGVRDEAALIGGIGPCGRVFCCCSWQKEFRMVNVRMAKVQELSLNPVAINGACGRLKCCLRFEYAQYCEAGAALPAFGAAVTWPEGQGTITGRDVMKGILVVRTPEGSSVRVPAGAVTVIPSSRHAGSGPVADGKGGSDEDRDRERSEPGPAGDA